MLQMDTRHSKVLSDASSLLLLHPGVEVPLAYVVHYAAYCTSSPGHTIVGMSAMTTANAVSFRLLLGGFCACSWPHCRDFLECS